MSQANSPNAVEAFLHHPIAIFERENTYNSDIPSIRSREVSQWSSHLAFLCLAQEQTFWPELTDFLSKTSQLGLDNWENKYSDDLSCRYPYGQLEVEDAVWTQYLRPIASIFQHKGNILQNTLQANRAELPTGGLDLHLELIGESCPYVSDKGESASRRHKLFIVSADGGAGGADSLSLAHGIEQLWATKKLNSEVQSFNTYLGRDQIWLLGDLQGMPLSAVETVLKGLVIVDIKIFGSLRKDDFTYLAANQVPFGITTPQMLQEYLAQLENVTMPDEARLEELTDTLAIIQDALRHCHHYGAPSIVVTDYRSAVRIDCHVNLAAVSRAPAANPTSRRDRTGLQWSFVERQDIRSTIVAALWGSLQRMNDAIASLSSVLPGRQSG